MSVCDAHHVQSHLARPYLLAPDFPSGALISRTIPYLLSIVLFLTPYFYRSIQLIIDATGLFLVLTLVYFAKRFSISRVNLAKAPFAQLIQILTCPKCLTAITLIDQLERYYGFQGFQLIINVFFTLSI